METQILPCALLCLALVVGLKEVRIQAPTAVKRGENPTLYCWYDTEGDPLYIVKWYKSGREFYRFVPREKPAIKSFSVGTLSVKESESNATQVTLYNVDLDAAGSFSCEVSADAPSFQTATVSASMDVVELPPQRPIISGLRSKYRIDDILRLNCSSTHSKPAANLTWYINNREVAGTQVEIHSVDDSSKSDGVTSGLLFPISSDSFEDGQLKIRCSASIYDIYWQSTEVSAEEERAKSSNAVSMKDVFGINYHQPPPNYQLGQKKLNGEIDIRVIGTSGACESGKSFVDLRRSCIHSVPNVIMFQIMRKRLSIQ